MKNKYSLLSLPLLIALFSLTFAQCSSKPNDQQIQDSVTAKLQVDPSLNTIEASVIDGIVTLNGQCEGNDCSAKAQSIAAEVDGVQSVTNNITMNTDTDLTLRTSVQAIISKYVGVQADVADGAVVLRGTINKDQLQPLMNELEALQPKSLDNQLAVQ